MSDSMRDNTSGKHRCIASKVQRPPGIIIALACLAR